MVGRDGVEPSQPQAADLQSVELTNAQPPHKLRPWNNHIGIPSNAP
jgi:hypothetical protein